VRKFAILVLILVAVAGVLAFYLKATTPTTSEGIRFPLNQAQRELLASAPANAEAFALIPKAAVVRAKLIANPVTHDPFLAWADTAPVPRSWMIGGADLVVWRAGKQTSYAIHLDPIRAAIVRLYLMMGSSVEAQVSTGSFLINAGAASPLGLARADELLKLASGFEQADVLIVQQGRGSSGFPPIARPAVTAIQIGKDDVNLISVAAGGGGAPPIKPETVRFPVNALVSATFTEPPRVVGDLDRLFLTRVSHLLDNGGSLIIYDVNPGTLMPRPDGLIVANNTPANQDLVSKIEEPVRVFGEIKSTPKTLLVAFDKDSMHRYEIENFVESHWATNDWAMRMDPKRVVPLVEKLGDSTGLRLAAPRIYRSIRDLRRWIGYLSAAQSLEAAHSTDDSGEVLRVRIASK